MFLSILRIDLEQGGDEYGNKAAYHHETEELSISEGFLYISCHHARYHHTQGHEGST